MILKEVPCKECGTLFPVDTSKRSWQNVKLCDGCRRCSVAGCDKRRFSHGLCVTHNYRRKKGLPVSATAEELEAIRRKAISSKKKGIAQSAAHRAAIGAAQRKTYEQGRVPYNQGRSPSAETREKLRAAALKQVQEGRINKDGLKIGQTRTAAERTACWTDEQRAAQAARTLAAYQDGRMQVHGRYKGHWSVYDGPRGVINMRSKSEVIFARDLDAHGVNWCYEPRRFDLGWATYCPDFHLVDLDLWVEVKGSWNDEARRKFAEFGLLHHAYVVLAQDLLNMERRLSAATPG